MLSVVQKIKQRRVIVLEMKKTGQELERMPHFGV